MGRGASYLEPAERSMEVVEGQDTVVDCQEAEEPGGTDQEKQQKAAAKAPAVEQGRTQGDKHASCKAHAGDTQGSWKDRKSQRNMAVSRGH